MNTSARREPSVTVVIPAYNAAAFVCNAIESALAQTRGRVEVVVVDDASTDNTSDVVAPYVERGQAKLVRHERNKGLPGTRNTAIRHSQGEYVAFLDADDLWYPHHLEVALDALEAHPELDAVFMNFDIVEMTTGEKLGDWFADRHQAMTLMKTRPLDNGALAVTDGFLEALFHECILHMQSVVARRGACEKVMFDESLRRSEDLDWAMRLAFDQQGRVAYHPRSTGIYHRHAHSLTTVNAQNFELIGRTELKLFQRYVNEPGVPAPLRAHLRRRLVELSLEVSYYLRLRGAVREAWDTMVRSLSFGRSAAQFTELAKVAATGMKHLLRPAAGRKPA